jgi:hypothetical protein
VASSTTLSSAFSREPRSSPFRPIGQCKDPRSLDVRESDKIDEKQLATWIKQAAFIPGWDGGSRLELAAVQIFSTTSRER